MPEKQEKLEDYCTKTFELLKNVRSPYEAEVDEVIKFVNHGRRKISDKDGLKGGRTGQDIYDGTAMSAASLASDGIHGYLCSQSIHWFDFTLPGKLMFSRTSGLRRFSGKRLDDYPDVKVWLDDCEEVQYAAFSRSNFYEQNPLFVREGMTIGTATDLIEEDVATGKIYIIMPHFRECYIAENIWGDVDTLYRECKYTLKQLVEKFGLEKIKAADAKFEKMYNDNKYTEICVLRAIYPRNEYNPQMLNGKNRPIASMWILPEAQNKLLEESGYYGNPSITWRWRKNSDEIYGRSPAWDAMVEIKKAQQQGRSNLIAGHKMVEPPWAAPEDLRGKIRKTPDSITYVEGVFKDRIPIPMIQGIQLPYGLELQERTEKIIKEYFHTDFFLMLYQAMINKVDLTATQVVGMQSEQAAVLGTRVGNFQTEALNKIQDRFFEIETRAGRMPPPPDILLEYAGGQSIEIDYQGPLAQSQKKLFKTQSITAGLTILTEMANIDPSVLDRVSTDKTLTEYLEAIGFPAIAINSDEVVEKLRLQRAQAQQTAMTIDNMENISKTTKNLSKGAEEDSPLAALAGA